MKTTLLAAAILAAAATFASAMPTPDSGSFFSGSSARVEVATDSGARKQAPIVVAGRRMP